MNKTAKLDYPWARRRRRCELEKCNQLFKPKRKEQRFCCSEHRSEYHFKTPTFRKFEQEIETLIRKIIKQMVKPGALAALSPQMSIAHAKRAASKL